MVEDRPLRTDIYIYIFKPILKIWIKLENETLSNCLIRQFHEFCEPSLGLRFWEGSQTGWNLEFPKFSGSKLSLGVHLV